MPTIANDSGPREKESHLADKVKDALKDNIFLKPNGLEVVVIDEKDGFVKLSLAKGNRELREMLAGGADLDSSASEAELSGSDLKQSWTALKKAVGYVKTIDGVKAVLVTAETNTTLDQARDLLAVQAQPEAARVLTDARLRLLESAITTFRMSTGGYPVNLASLLRDDGTPNWAGPYLKSDKEFADAWGTPFAYERKGNTYENISAGPDRIVGTPDDIK